MNCKRALVSHPMLSSCLRVRNLKTAYRYLFLVIICIFLSVALTFATYFYSHVSIFGFGWGWSVNRGLPLSWAVETHYHVEVIPESVFYPYDFQALNFSLDFVFWLTVLLLPLFLFLYRKRFFSVSVKRLQALFN